MTVKSTTRGIIMLAVFVLVAALLAACGPYPAQPPDPPLEGAAFVVVLEPRRGTDESPCFETGEYRFYNDGTATGWILVLEVWKGAPEGFVVRDGAYVEKNGYLFQNDGGKLYIWEIVPAPHQLPEVLTG